MSYSTTMFMVNNLRNFPSVIHSYFLLHLAMTLGSHSVTINSKLLVTLGRAKQMNNEGFGPQLIMLSRPILYFIVIHLSTNFIVFPCLTKTLSSFLHYLFHLPVPFLMCSGTSSQFLSCSCYHTSWFHCHFYPYYFPFVGLFFTLSPK